MSHIDLKNFKVTRIPINLIIFVAAVTVIAALTILVRSISTGHVSGNKVAMEYAYFEGQKDALNGKIHIKYDESSKKYHWQSSCWDDGTKPTFDPSTLK